MSGKMSVLHQIKSFKTVRNIFIFSVFSLQLQYVHLHHLKSNEFKGIDTGGSIYKDTFEKLNHAWMLTDKNDDHTAMKRLIQKAGNVYQANLSDSAEIPDLYLSKIRKMFINSDEVNLKSQRLRRNATLKENDSLIRNKPRKKLSILLILKQINQLLAFIVNRRDKHQQPHRHLHRQKHGGQEKEKAPKENTAPLFVG